MSDELRPNEPLTVADLVRSLFWRPADGGPPRGIGGGDQMAGGSSIQDSGLIVVGPPYKIVTPCRFAGGSYGYRMG
jgi:hypothetical protein